MTLRALLARLTPLVLAEWFVASNLAFLAVDILLAHASNQFERPVEWLPIAFSAVAPLLLLPGLLSGAAVGWGRRLGLAVGAVSIAVGLAGLLLHLESGFFAQQTLHKLVYAAPFVAPLSYVGLGLLLVLNRLEDPVGPAWAPWVIFLALAGTVGNFGLALLDHAQNGFFSQLEWMSVAAAALGTGFLFVALLRPEEGFLRLCLAMLVLTGIVGAIGFGLHFWADLHHPATRLVDRLIYGAPVFAPLLLTDLAGLAAIGIWGQLRRAAQPRSSAA